jgi:magnesium-transporting ATPase (P-type)
MRLYRKIIVSSIYTAQNNGFMSDVWKFTSNFYVSAALASNILLFCVLLHLYVIRELFNFLPLENKNFVLYVYIFLIILLMIFNYTKFYLNDKYKSLIKENKTNYNKKTFTIYFLISFLLSFSFLFLKK